MYIKYRLQEGGDYLVLDIAIELATQSKEIELQMCSSGIEIEERKNCEYKLQYMYQNKKVKKIQNTQTNPQSERATSETWLDTMEGIHNTQPVEKKNVISAVGQITLRACAKKKKKQMNMVARQQ